MKVKFLFFTFMFFLVGCTFITKKIYGIKKPKIETDGSIQKKANKFHLDTTNIVTVNVKDFVKVLNKNGIPECNIYDRNGKYIEYRETDTSCNAGLFDFIPDLKLNVPYNQPDSIPLNSELMKYRDLKGLSLKEVENADFYVLIYWTVWTGKLNKDHVKIWEDLAKNNKNCKIKVIKVNLDMQDYWDENERKEIVKAMGKL